MAKLGVCAIEADDPTKVVSVVPGAAITGDMLSMACLDAMAGGYGSETMRANVTTNIHAMLKKKPTP